MFVIYLVITTLKPETMTKPEKKPYQTITINWDGSAFSAGFSPQPSAGHSNPGVKCGLYVQWVAGDGVSSIKDIFLSTKNPDVFSEVPTSENKWMGLISKTASGEEAYCVAVETTSNGRQIWDPKIRVNPNSGLVL